MDNVEHCRPELWYNRTEYNIRSNTRGYEKLDYDHHISVNR